MASNNDVSSQMPVLSRLDGLEKIAGGFEKAIRKAGLWQKAIHQTATSFLEKLATPAQTAQQQPRAGKDAGKAAQQVNPGNATPASPSGTTARNRVQEYAGLTEKTLFQFPEQLPGGHKQQATGYDPAPELKIAASTVQVEQATAMPGTVLTGKNVNPFYNRLIRAQNETVGEVVSKSGGYKSGIEQVIDTLPQTAKNSGYLNMMIDLPDTVKSKITGFRGKEIQQQAAAPIEKKATGTPFPEFSLPANAIEQYDGITQPKASAQKLYSGFMDVNNDDAVQYPGANTAAPLMQTLTEMENAAGIISGSGGLVKNYNITINDGLIRQVDNHFNSTGESPESASGFMQKLTDALQLILNDVNYTLA